MRNNIFDPSFPITKMHGTGNDLVVYVDFDEKTKPKHVRQICDRHYGIGADGVVTITKSRVANAEFRMKYFNSDGSLAEMCGNGIRCFAKYLIDNKLVTGTKKITVDTDAGILIPEVLKNTKIEAQVKVNMGKPMLWNPKHVTKNPGKDGIVRVRFPMSGLEGKKKIILDGMYISMGNPHAVFFVKKDLGERYAKEFGRQIEINKKTFPQKTNVEFVEVTDKKNLKVYVWERGSGLTLACGTGACAAFALAILNNYVDTPAKIKLPGGILEMSWEGKGKSIFMSGPTENVFDINDLDKFLLKEYNK
jgi:diaminopimelate epimerase